MRKITFIIRLLVVPAVCASLALATALPVRADDDMTKSEDKVEESVTLETVKVVLQRKSSKAVSTYSGDKYGLDRTTLIINESGGQIRLEYLRVPCDAELLYETKADSSAFLHRIKVLSTHSGSTNRMEGPPR